MSDPPKGFIQILAGPATSLLELIWTWIESFEVELEEPEEEVVDPPVGSEILLTLLLFFEFCFCLLLLADENLDFWALSLLDPGTPFDLDLDPTAGFEFLLELLFGLLSKFLVVLDFDLDFEPELGFDPVIDLELELDFDVDADSDFGPE